MSVLDRIYGPVFSAFQPIRTQPMTPSGTWIDSGPWITGNHPRLVESRWDSACKREEGNVAKRAGPQQSDGFVNKQDRLVAGQEHLDGSAFAALLLDADTDRRGTVVAEPEVIRAGRLLLGFDSIMLSDGSILPEKGQLAAARPGIDGDGVPLAAAQEVHGEGDDKHQSRQDKGGDGPLRRFMTIHRGAARKRA